MSEGCHERASGGLPDADDEVKGGTVVRWRRRGGSGVSPVELKKEDEEEEAEHGGC